jgi:hypothetical protein
MTKHDAHTQMVTCAVCGNRMRLQRRARAPSLGEGHEYQYWECDCGNVKVIPSAPDRAADVK